VGGLDTQEAGAGSTIVGDYAYIAGRNSGLQIFDITDPVNPRFIGGMDTPGRAMGVAVSGPHVYIADGDSGLAVVPVQCDQASSLGDAVHDDGRAEFTLLLRAAPNPSSGQISIRFSIPGGGFAQTSVLDLSGRVVRKLADAPFGAGVHDLAWDAHDEEGRAVAAGIYLIRVTTADSEHTTRVVIVR
jgi:hypothetical protein